MKKFFVHFFGEGTSPEFALFTPSHFAPILLMLALIALIIRFAKRIRLSRHEETLRYIMAFALIISDMSYYWRLVGASWLNPAPWKTCPLAYAAGP